MRELRIDGTLILAVDHGYGNIKTANTVFSNGFVERDTEPVMSTDYLYYGGKYYVLDQGHKNYTKDKVMDMNIVSILPEYIKPKNVGLMFFSMEPDKFFPYTQIDVVQFPSGLGGNDIIEKTFKGPIHQQLRDALQYIKNVIIT